MDFRKKLYEAVSRRLQRTEEISDEEIYRTIDEALATEGRKIRVPYKERMRYREVLFSAFRGFDILSVAMMDEDVTEVMANGPEHIYVERNGVIEEYRDSFTSEAKLSDVVQRIAAVNRRVNEASPMVDARLPDGSRAHIALPPVAVDGPVVTIRRFPKEPVSMEKLLLWGALTEEAKDFLESLVSAGYNIFVSGGTGAGKTTFLGALAEFIPEGERVITIEDSAELRLRNVRNLVRLEARPANLEGEYEVTIRDLIRNALRMRPDRIIVGECRGAESLDMLQAMNTGHDGSLSTGHANSARDMLSRIETMCLMGNVELPLPAIRRQIEGGLDIIVHLRRFRDRTRKVEGIYEVAGFTEDGEIALTPIFLFREEGEKNGEVLGKLERTGAGLTKTEKLTRAGKKL